MDFETIKLFIYSLLPSCNA